MSRYFVSCARGLEAVTAEELGSLGVSKTEVVPGGVFFEGDQDHLYKAHLWLRSGQRVLLSLRSFRCHTPEDLYENVKSFRWETFLTKGKTFSVDFTISGRNGPRISHSHFARLKAKDAIADRMREKTGQRPDVDTDAPSIRPVFYLRDGLCTLNLDATGESLHERGYRPSSAEAPLKETLAAGILALAQWDKATPLFDPFCGSGTFLCEAAMKAMNWAPGLLRHHYPFMEWPDYHEPRWERLVGEAESARVSLPKGLVRGADQNGRAIQLSRTALKVLGLDDVVSLEQRPWEHTLAPKEPKGLLVANPPYGERMGEVESLVPLYKSIGDGLKQLFPGWRAAIFTGSAPLAKSIGLRPTKRIPLWNGPIECRLLTYDLYAGPSSSTEESEPDSPAISE
jgi:putative N6-adenine-specific DNA methylase